MAVYYYHGDHLGSSSVITDKSGAFYEALEYFPYGEMWVQEKAASGQESLPYKFTGKILDPETGLYYHGARYRDAKVGNWLSPDPILEKYLPKPNDFDTEHDYFWYIANNKTQNLPGIGGVFNPVNLNLYHYAGQNPVKLIDPDGNQQFPIFQYGSQEDIIYSIMQALTGGGSDRINRYSNDFCNFLAESPLSPNFYGLRFVANGGYGGNVRVGPVNLDMSLRANVDSEGNLWASFSIGPKVGKNTSAGIFITGKVLQNGKFQPDLTKSIGLTAKNKNKLKGLLRNLTDYKNFEIGAGVSGHVGMEVRWKPYTLIKNLSKLFERK